MAADDFYGFPKLEQLYLNNNSIAEVPPKILKIRNLFYLLSAYGAVELCPSFYATTAGPNIPMLIEQCISVPRKARTPSAFIQVP